MEATKTIIENVCQPASHHLLYFYYKLNQAWIREDERELNEYLPTILKNLNPNEMEIEMLIDKYDLLTIIMSNN